MESLIINRFNIINKSFLTVKDIMVLMECSSTVATKYRTKFLNKYGSKDNFIQVRIPTSLFIEFYKLDVNMIRDNYVTIQKLRGGNLGKNIN